MSRSGYVDDFDDCGGRANLWYGTVRRAIRGKRGQKLLRDMRDALDAMPDKRLIPQALVDEDGGHCALGALGAMRGIDMSAIDPEEPEHVAAAFSVAPALVREISFENDDFYPYGNQENVEEKRWKYMRIWVERNIIKPADLAEGGK